MIEYFSSSCCRQRLLVPHQADFEGYRSGVSRVGQDVILSHVHHFQLAGVLAAALLFGFSLLPEAVTAACAGLGAKPQLEVLARSLPQQTNPDNQATGEQAARVLVELS